MKRQNKTLQVLFSFPFLFYLNAMVDTSECKKRELKVEAEDTSASKKIKSEPMEEEDATLLANSVTEPSSLLPDADESVNLKEETKDEAKDEAKDETKEPDFSTTSMYTDEFNTMLETVLSGEQFLFDTYELQVFEQFQLLEGSVVPLNHTQ